MKLIIALMFFTNLTVMSQDWGWDITEKKESSYTPPGEDDSLYLSLIKYYQENISPLQGDRCPFYPSCSHFTLEAMDQFGFKLGFIMGLERIYFRENQGLFTEPVYYMKLYGKDKRRLYDSIWANNIFKESSWFFYNYYFNIRPSDSK